jgi:hypothetical protein
MTEKNARAWETPITIKIMNASIQGNTMVAESVSVNDKASQVVYSSIWDSEYSWFYFQFFFELWLYSSTGSSFQFHDRFVGIWLNMTG